VPPNVLLVILDAARRDALEPYGAAPGSTPVIAQLANRGKTLEDVHATACWTVPSHASIFTGLLPRAAGLSRAPSPNAVKPVIESHAERLLPEVMRAAGYATGAVSANLWISNASGYDTGFDDFAGVDSGRDGRFQGPSGVSRLRWLTEAARGKVDDGAAEAQDVFRRWIERPPSQPFFWFVNLIECHSPYLPPRVSSDVSLLGRLRAAEDARSYYGLDNIWKACVGAFEVPEATLERMRRMYRDSIRYMDTWLGELLERLDAGGMLDDTIVIVTSDHGENLGEGGLVTHAFSLDERLIHVPFILAGPGADTAAMTSLAQLPRVIAEAVGLEDHPWRTGPPDGIGVAQFDPPVDPGHPRVDETGELWGLDEEARRRLTTPLTCAVADGLKLLRRGEREELYDLSADPLEVAPMAADEVGAELVPKVARLRAALDHPAVASARGEESSAAAAGEPTAEELRDIEERMKLLGYM
jgi:arylsulfatase A-like enzyme